MYAWHVVMCASTHFSHVSANFYIRKLATKIELTSTARPWVGLEGATSCVKLIAKPLPLNTLLPCVTTVIFVPGF